MKKTLVTGACGFIGSHLVEELVRRGHQVRAFVYYNSFNSWGWLDHASPEVKGKFEVFAGDVRDPFAVREAARDCDKIFHLAALIGIPYSYHAPDNYVETNVKGTLNVVQAAREFNSRILCTSTSEVYGTAKFVPITEEHPLQGQSPYSASKIGADQMAISFYNSFKTPVTIVRPFNTYGPRQSARAIIPTVITQLLNGAKEIKLGSLHPTRDLSYVGDTVHGMIAASETDKTIGKTVNLGAGFEIAMGDLVTMIQTIMGTKAKIVEESVRVRPEGSEVERLLSDNTLANKLMSWRPEYVGTDGLRKGLEKTIEWFRDPKNLATYKSGIYNI